MASEFKNTQLNNGAGSSKNAAKKSKNDKRWWQIWKPKVIEVPVPIYKPVDAIATQKVENVTNKLSETLIGIESQLDKVDEQNQMLLLTVGTLKENNQVLLQQIQTLSDTNKQLFEKIQASRKRERIFKIIAALSSIIAFSVGVYNLIRIIRGG